MAESTSDRFEYRLCRLNDLPEGQSKGFAGKPDAHYADILVARANGEIHAYRNRCPHTGAPMEWGPDQFLDYSGTLIQCGIHGALFRIDDGYCIAGPCARRSLRRVAVIERDGWLIALEPLERTRG